MLEKEISKLPEFLKNPSKISNYNFKKVENLYNYVRKLPTIQKIFIVQNLLKEMKSIKERFNDNKQKMIDKIDSNSFKYFKNAILIKQIYDYSCSKNPEVFLNYTLTKNKIEDLYKFEEEKNKNFIENFFFELRNNNSLMLKIIEEIEPEYYEQLTYFMVHFLYENPTNSSFEQDELMIITYLIFEKIIINKLPYELEAEDLVNDFGVLKKKSFLYYYLLAFTRKFEIRNYFSSILYNNILELENYQKVLNLSVRTIVQSLVKIEDEKEENDRKKKNSTINKNIENILKGQKMLHKSILLTKVSDVIDSNKQINDTYKKTRYSSDISKLMKSFNVNENNVENDNNRKMSDLNNNIKNNIDFKNDSLDSFFKENNLKKFVISKKLQELNNKTKNEIESAYMELLKFLNDQYHKENSENIEIFSNFAVSNSFKTTKLNQNNISIEEINNIYLDNYNKIVEFIEEIFNKIKDNIKSLPYQIKLMLYILKKLLEKKYIKKERHITFYQKYMIELRFLFGGLIIPILSNPIYNGIISDNVVSETTIENLNIISRILEKFISGNLFNITNTQNEEISYTIFNSFIVDKITTLFEIIINIEKDLENNFEAPFIIKNLLSSNDKNNMDIRNINYDFFQINKEENIRYQSICFSPSDLMMFVHVIEKMKNTLITKNEKESNEFLLLKYYKILNQMHLNNKNENKKEYIFLSNLTYKDSFLKEIRSITEDHIESYFKSQKSNNNNIDNNNIIIKEEVPRLKKCLIDILIYSNKLHKENFNPFIQRKDDIILHHNSEINRHLRFKKLFLYNETHFEGEKRYSISSLNDSILRKKTIKKALAEDTLEDADFLKDIFPRIVSNIKYEIGNNYDNPKLEKIIFFISYLQIHIRKLPEEYTKNNFSKLFVDIMIDIENLINILENSILNQFYLKIREGDKLDLIMSKYSYQIKNMEKYICIGYLFNKLCLPDPFESSKIDKSQTSSMENLTLSLYDFSISEFIKNFPDFRKNEQEIDDIIEEENRKEVPNILKKYFKEIQNLIKEEKFITKYSQYEFLSINYELESYILFKLYEKLFPKFQTKKDDFIYKKCCRLSFIRPENIIKEKKLIKENLLETAMEYVNEMDNKYTPVDKIKMFGKAFQILQNSITFSTGKTDLGIDDTLPLLIYVIIKSQPKKINTNYIFCKYYINAELEKKYFGILLMQVGMVIKIITEMKYTDLIGVTQEQFGDDNQITPGFRRTNNLQGQANINIK